MPLTPTARRAATILVVDDQDANRYAVVRTLQAAGFRTREATSGLDALAALDPAPDLVVLDVELPDIDGFEVCRRLRANADTAAIPVLHLSASYTSVDSRAQGLLTGDAYLTHPFEPLELVALINALLRMRDAEAERLIAHTSEMEDRYRMVFEQTPLPMWIVDEETLRYLAVNTAAIQHYGWSREEWLTKRVTELQLPAKVEALLHTIEQARHSPTVRNRTQHRRQDGSVIDVDIIAHAFSFVGRPARLVIATDITAQRRADETIRASEERFRALTEHTTDLVVVIGVDGSVQYASPAHQRAVGVPAGELVGRSLLEFVHPDDVGATRVALEHLIANKGEALIIPIRVCHVDGTCRTIEFRGENMLDDPAVRGIVCNGRDISERREAEQALRFRANLLDAVEQAVIATTVDGRITYWNRFAERLYGWAEHEVLGRDIVEVTPNQMSRAQGEEIMRQLTTGESWSGSFEVQARDGRRFIAHVWDSPILDESGTLIGVVGVSVDASERLAFEERLRQSQKLEAVGKLAGGVAHDFNNLLTVIRGSNEFVAETLPPDSIARADVAEIATAVERASGLTRQLLAFSRKQVLTPRVLDLNQVVEDVKRMLARLIGEDISLRTELAPSIGSVLADRGQLEQVLVNFVVNSRDAMPRGGTVTISTGECVVGPEGDAGGGSAPPGRYVTLSVRDTGHGMDRVTLEHAFEPFFTTKGVGQGTGLGLSTAYGIVRQSGGDIRVRSEPGQGAEFTVLLPRRDPVTEVRAPITPNVLGGNERILLVEDEEPVRRVARRVLERLGYDVIEATNGRHALELFRQHGPTIELVVTDTVMPEMGGRELVEALRRERPDVRAMYMSGYTDDEIIRRGVDPSTAFLQKPFSAESFGAAVRETLERPGAEADTDS